MNPEKGTVRNYSVMSSNPTLTEADKGKRVINNAGNEIGRVVEIKSGAAYVDPDPDLTDTFKSKLGWGDMQSEETYRLDPTNIDTVTDDEIRVNM